MNTDPCGSGSKALVITFHQQSIVITEVSQSNIGSSLAKKLNANSILKRRKQCDTKLSVQNVTSVNPDI